MEDLKDTKDLMLKNFYREQAIEDKIMSLDDAFKKSKSEYVQERLGLKTQLMDIKMENRKSFTQLNLF